MKFMGILFLCLFTVLTMSIQAQDRQLSSLQKQALQALNIPDVDLGTVGEAVVSQRVGRETEGLTASGEDRPAEESALTAGIVSLYGYSPFVAIVPLSEELSYLDGAPCHVGHYAQFSIITVLEGINWGFQLIMDYKGRILFMGPFYSADRGSSGVIFRHEYSNATVVTGSNQVVYLF